MKISRRLFILIALAWASVLGTGCSYHDSYDGYHDSYGDHYESHGDYHKTRGFWNGAILGAGAGALIGHAAGDSGAGALIGAGAGALLGALFGHSVDEYEHGYDEGRYDYDPDDGGDYSYRYDRHDRRHHDHYGHRHYSFGFGHWH